MSDRVDDELENTFYTGKNNAQKIPGNKSIYGESDYKNIKEGAKDVKKTYDKTLDSYGKIVTDEKTIKGGNYDKRINQSEKYYKADVKTSYVSGATGIVSGVAGIYGGTKKVYNSSKELKNGDILNQYTDNNDFVRHGELGQQKGLIDIAKGGSVIAKGVKNLNEASKSIREIRNIQKAFGSTWKESKAIFKALNASSKASKLTKCAMLGKASSVASAAKAAFDVFEWVWHELRHEPSPVETYIIKPFSGDWDKMQEAMKQWSTLAEDISDAAILIIDALQKLEDDDWAGAAATAFFTEQIEILNTISPLPQSCIYINKALESAADYAKNIIDYFLEAILSIVDLLSSLAAVIATAGLDIWDDFKLVSAVISLATTVNNMNQLINDYHTALHNLQSVVSNVQQSSDGLSKLNSKIGV